MAALAGTDRRPESPPSPPVPSLSRTRAMDMNDRQVEPDLLARAARCLSRRERAVLVMSAGEGLPLEVVAERLGLDLVEAGRLLADALLKLDRALRRLERPWWRFW